ncbi:hypothetical protein BD779DRAFT_1476023 [Infundibulicybe gibba]|nr:hypothetical protein BD779DRAFT_1476023 [Infundibulicybe gibba]
MSHLFDADTQVMESRGSVRARKATVPRVREEQQEKRGLDELTATAAGVHKGARLPRLAKRAAMENRVWEELMPGGAKSSNKRPPSTPGRGSEKVKVSRTAVGLSPGPPAALRQQAKIPKRSGAAMDDSGSEVDGTDSRHSLGGSDLAHPSESDDDMEVDDEAEQSNQESEDDLVDSYGSSEGFIDSQTMLEERANWRKLNSSDVDDDAGDTTLRAPSRPESIVSSDENTAFLDTDDFNPPLDPEEAPMLSQLARPSLAAQGVISADHHTNSRHQAPSPSIQQLESQSARTTVKSSSVKIINKGKTKQISGRSNNKEIAMRVSTSTKAAPSQPRPTAKPAYKGASKRQEKLEKESANWVDDDEVVFVRQSTTKSTRMKTDAYVKQEGAKINHAEHDEDQSDAYICTDTDVDTDAIPPTIAWPLSTDLHPGSLLNQTDEMTELIRLNMQDVVSNILFVNAYPDRLEVIESTTKSLLIRSKELDLLDIHRRIQQDRPYLKRILRLSLQHIHNTRTSLWAICTVQCAAHYKIKMGDRQRVKDWLQKRRFTFPGDSPEMIDRSKPFEHLAILSTLETAFFRGISPTLAEKYVDLFPTALVKGQVVTMIPKVMLASVATTTQSPDGRGFGSTEMEQVYIGLVALMDLFEKEHPVLYRAMMVNIFDAVW